MNKYKTLDMNFIDELKSNKRKHIGRTPRGRKTGLSNVIISGGVHKNMLTSVNSKSIIDKTEIKGLTSEKKELMKNLIGKYSCKMDINKVRDETIR